MTNKIPFDIVAMEAHKFIVRMALSYYDFNHHYDSYLDYIQACGWSNIEFDTELLKRIDKNWDPASKRRPLVWN